MWEKNTCWARSKRIDKIKELINVRSNVKENIKEMARKIKEPLTKLFSRYITNLQQRTAIKGETTSSQEEDHFYG